MWSKKNIILLASGCLTLLIMTKCEDTGENLEDKDKSKDHTKPHDIPDQYKDHDAIKTEHYKDGEHDADYDHQALWGKTLFLFFSFFF